MIPGFFTDIQQDVMLVINKTSSKLPQSKEQDKRVSLAALRIFAAIGMAVAILLTVSAIPYLPFAPAGAVVQASIGAILYFACRDIYLISKNMSDQMSTKNEVLAGVKSIWGDLVDLWNGNKNEKDAPRHPVTENTFFRPLWDAILARRHS